MLRHVRLLLLLIPLLGICQTTLAKSVNILLIAGPDSHYYGAHDFEGGVKFLAQALRNASPEIKVRTQT